MGNSNRYKVFRLFVARLPTALRLEPESVQPVAGWSLLGLDCWSCTLPSRLLAEGVAVVSLAVLLCAELIQSCFRLWFNAGSHLRVTCSSTWRVETDCARLLYDGVATRQSPQATTLDSAGLLLPCSSSHHARERVLLDDWRLRNSTLHWSLTLGGRWRRVLLLFLGCERHGYCSADRFLLRRLE